MNEIQGVRMIFIGWYVIDLRGSCAKYTLDDTQDFDTHPTGAKNPKDEADGWISKEYRT